MLTRMKRLESFTLLVEIQNDATIMENRLEIPQKVKNNDTTISPPGTYSKKLKSGYQWEC